MTLLSTGSLNVLVSCDQQNKVLVRVRRNPIKGPEQLEIKAVPSSVDQSRGQGVRTGSKKAK